MASTKKTKKKKPIDRRAKMEERAKKLRDRSKGGFKYFVFKEGTVRMRMPQVNESEEFCQEVVFIYLGKDMGGYISPDTFGEPCPFVELYNELTNGNDDDKAVAQRISPKKRYMGPFYRFKDEKGRELDADQGVKLALLTGTQYQDLTDYYLDDECGDFTDPIEGYDLKFKRTGSGMKDTEYTITPCKPTKLLKVFSKEVYSPEQMVRDLIPTYEQAEELLEKFLGNDSADEKPKKKKTSNKKRSKGDM